MACIVALNRAVAVAMAEGPETALPLVDRLEGELGQYHLWHAVRADLLRQLGRTEVAAAHYRQARALAQNEVERRFLERRLLENRAVNRRALSEGDHAAKRRKMALKKGDSFTAWVKASERSDSEAWKHNSSRIPVRLHLTESHNTAVAIRQATSYLARDTTP